MTSSRSTFAAPHDPRIEQACLEAVRAADQRAQAGHSPDAWPVPPSDPLDRRAASLWHDLGTIAGSAAPLERRPQRRHGVWRQAAAVAAILLVPIGGLILADRPQVHETRIGERQTVALADGSGIVLNTSSRVAVRYRRATREIELERGEAVFTVRADARRPFTVATGRTTITAVGTAFQVRRDDNATEVTLINGRIRLDADTDGVAASRLIGSPGSFVRLSGGTVTLGRVDPAATLAWRRGELVLDMTPLATAVAEMNRYSTTKIVLTPGLAQGRQLTGIFKTSDSLPFAKTVAALYGLSITARPDVALLSEANNKRRAVDR